MKRRIKDSDDMVAFFRNYGSNLLSMMILETEGEADFSFNQYDFEDFLNLCDDIAENINGFYNFGADYDNRNNDCFFAEFYTTTPLDVNPEELDYDTAEKVGEVRFQITLLPKPIFSNALQNYAELRNSYYGGR